ncbi:MAG TPA: invasion associated locus B family protein [Acetobacteraceae bacterium]|nr:invasion associated locus B family protein [Acetobacteraceae bacterium]
MPLRSRFLLALAAGLLAVPAARAAPHHSSATKTAAGSAAPKALGTFGAWTAATYEQNGQTVCYAFTRAHPVGTAGPNGPLLTVTERPASRDEVAITGTSEYPKDSEVMLQVGQAGVEMYTAGRDAFARDPKAAVAALRRGSQAVARAPDTHGARSVDTYSLDGFTKAYDAIIKACPAR